MLCPNGVKCNDFYCLSGVIGKDLKTVDTMNGIACGS